MFVYIGPYKNWIGPHQISDMFGFLPILQRDREAIGDWLSETWVYDFCLWMESKRQRTVKVKIHNYDVWNMDTTLAIIVLPMLKQLRLTKHGSPNVSDDDVPEHLKKTSAPPVENDWDTDDNFFKRWDWVLGEMIWTFEQLQHDYEWNDAYFSIVDTDKERTMIDDLLDMPSGKTRQFDREGYSKHNDRIDNGLRLFGTYYRGLWD